ncbi:hypothetical protein ACTK8Z_004729, partial [Yersinia enterocolitica]
MAGAETARDEAVAAKTAAQSAEAAAEGSATSASGSATTASDAAAAATDSASIASEAATIATQSKDGAVTARDEAEQFAESVNLDLLMHTTGGTFTGPVTMVGNAVNPLEPVTKQQFDSIDLSTLMPKTGGAFTGPVILAGDATDPKGAVTKQQLEAHQKIAVLYPGGTDAAPGTIAANQVISVTNPFPGRLVAARAEVYYNAWGEAGWGSNTVSGGSATYGVKAVSMNADIAVVSGPAAPMGQSNLLGNA